MSHDRTNEPYCREMFQMTCDECEALLREVDDASSAGEPEEAVPGDDVRRAPVD